MASNAELLDIIYRLEQRVSVLETMVSAAKQPKKSSSKHLEYVPHDDYETYIANISAKYSNIDEILKIYENMEGIRTKKNKLLFLQKMVYNMLCNDCGEKIQTIPLRFSANQLYNYTSEHGNTDELQWRSLQLSHFINHIKLIIQNILRESRKWSEMPSSNKYSTEFKDCIFISISEIFGIIYNDDEFEKIIKCVIKKLQ